MADPKAAKSRLVAPIPPDEELPLVPWSFVKRLDKLAHRLRKATQSVEQMRQQAREAAKATRRVRLAAQEDAGPAPDRAAQNADGAESNANEKGAGPARAS